MGDLAAQLAAKFNTPTPQEEQDTVAAGGSTLAQLAALIEQTTGIEAKTVTAETDLRDVHRVNSLALVELVVKAEEHFGVRIEGSAAQQLRYAGDFVRFIERHQD